MFEVTNQPPPLENYNLFATDAALREAVAREGADWAADELTEFGGTLGEPETIQAGFDANKYSPTLNTFNRFGHRLDEVEFHPAWHQLLGLGVRYGLHSSPWAKPRRGAHVARAAGTYLLTQVESGVYCPIAMTYGSVPTLRHSQTTASEWLPHVFGRDYDRRARPVKEKGAALLGMAMTENQGGSDLRTNITRAMPANSDGDGVYRIDGHKWFMSAPMCDAFMVLAQTEKGPTCFLVPRFKPDGTRNGIHLLRLKDKLGNRSNASSEAEFVDAYAERIGDEGRGIPTIVEMANHTRLDCALGASGLMRQALAQAVHHASYRTAFQKKLIDQPLMTNVLADLALEVEAATVLSLRLARAYDEQEDAIGAVYRRVVTPATKFWICKRSSYLAQEAMEVIGGSGYIEECVMPRIYREMPVNSIWEGSGNVMCLDVLRAFARTPDAAAIILGELAP
ncbi:MAG: putative acyl-CoA dehydrogenase, partial [Variibacter sp.]|nr:putative acyl-CoA dehydrogenase [Variibacter sp.]